MLYESLIHPLTVLSTLPSAGVGAVLALLLFRMDFSLIALIGVFLLIGIVKKNAILIIDFALEAERARGLSSLEAVREACLLRFRPILMTTLAAALGALPLAIGFGEGSELRQPLGVAIVGGLIASQLLTLLTTPVVYMLLDTAAPAQGRRTPSQPRRHRRVAALGNDMNANSVFLHRPTAWLLGAALATLSACTTLAPTYERPSVAAPAVFKEAPAADSTWFPAAPADTLDRGPWWKLFGDPALSTSVSSRSRCRTRTSPPPSPRMRRRRRWCASSARRCSPRSP